MSNLWLTLPLDDYEGHMKSPGVRQLGALADLFREVLVARSPESIAILGVAGGNGLEHVDNTITKRIVGLDINPQYLDIVQSRLSRLRGLQLFCFDLAETVVELEPVALVHAALIFEHAGLGRCLDNALSLVSRTGALSVVLQLPSTAEPEVSVSGFPTIQRLASDFSLIDPKGFCENLRARGFQMINESRQPLKGGKAFWMGIFVRE